MTSFTRILPLILLPWICLSLAAQEKIHLFFTGGIHGYLLSDETRQQGGILPLQAAISDISASHVSPDQRLLLDTGEALAYHYLARLDSGRTVLAQMARAGYDAMTVGNLDFKYGRENLRRLNAAYPDLALLAANVVDADGTPFLLPFRIFKRSGLRIGVVGAIEQRLEQNILPGHLGGLHFSPLQESLQQVVQTLRPQCDLIVALNHSGFYENLELARRIKGLDVIIGRPEGDSLDMVQLYDPHNRLKSVVMKAAPNARAVGHLVVSMIQDDGAYRLHDAELQAYTDVITLPLSRLDNTPYEALERRYAEYCRRKYRGKGPDEAIIATQGAFRENYVDYLLYTLLKSTRSEIAIVNEGFFRFSPADTARKALTIRDIERINWSNENLSIMRLTGKDLKAILKRGVQDIPAGRGAHLRFLSIKNYQGSAGREVLIHGKPPQDNEVYAVVTTHFLASGGDGYREFLNGTHRRSRFQGTTRIVAGSSPQHQPVDINSLLVRFYQSEERPEFNALDAWFSRNTFLNRALWLVNLNNIDIAFRSVTVRNNENFSDVKDSRVNAATADLFSYALGGDISLVRQTRYTRWENSLLLKNARTRLGDGVLEESDDNLELESILDAYDLSSKIGLPRGANLFSSLRFDSELTPTQNQAGVDNPRQQDLYLTAGFSYLGKKLKEARLGFFGKYDLVDESLDSGIEFNSKYRERLGALNYQGALRLRYLISNQNPVAGDEWGSLDLSNGIEIAVTGSLRLRPQFDLFVFRDKFLAQTATNLQYSLNLTYSRVWKPQYLRFFRRDRK